jgi:hypothetical protein
MVHSDQNGKLVFGHNYVEIDDVMTNFHMKRRNNFIVIRLVHCNNHKSAVKRWLNRSLCITYQCTTSYGETTEVTYNVPQYIVDTLKPPNHLLSIHSGLNPEILRDERVKMYLFGNFAKSNSIFRHEV